MPAVGWLATRCELFFLKPNFCLPLAGAFAYFPADPKGQIENLALGWVQKAFSCFLKDRHLLEEVGRMSPGFLEG